MAQLEITLSQYGLERSLAHIWHTSFGGGRRMRRDCGNACAYKRRHEL